MSAPLLILVLGAVLAAAAYALRSRGGVPWLIAVLGSLLLGAVGLGIVLGEPFEMLGIVVRLDPAWTFLGRSLVLRAANRGFVSFVFFSAALLLAAGWAARAPRRLASIGMLVSLALAAAVMVQPFVFAPTFITAGAILGCLVVTGRQGSSGRAPPRLMVSYTLGMLAILGAGWLIEIGGATTSPESPARAASILLALGLAILVITPPFHTWLTAASDEAHPLPFVFVAVMLQSAGLLLLVDSLASYAWMRSDPVVHAFLRGVGLLMVGLGAWWSMVERRAARIVAYALLVGFGVSLLALSDSTPDGVRVSLGIAVARALGAAVWAAGAANVFVGGPAPDSAQPIRALSAAAAVLGALSLVGFPLTAGFAGLWATLTSAHGADPAATAVILLGTGATWFAVARWGWALSGHPTAPWRELGRGRIIFLAAGCAAVLVLAVLPGWMVGWTATGLAGFAGG